MNNTYKGYSSIFNQSMHVCKSTGNYRIVCSNTMETIQNGHIDDISNQCDLTYYFDLRTVKQIFERSVSNNNR